MIKAPVAAVKAGWNQNRLPYIRVVDSFCWTVGIDIFLFNASFCQLGPGFLLPDSLEPQNRKM